jgi:hypothetical protein
MLKTAFETIVLRKYGSTILNFPKGKKYLSANTVVCCCMQVRHEGKRMGFLKKKFLMI